MPANVIVTTADAGQHQADNNQGAIEEVALSTDVLAQGYVPALTSSGAGVLAAIGQFQALGIKDAAGDTQVIVRGSFQFTRAAAGVAETIDITLPTVTGLAPGANFAAVTDATGDAQMAGIHAATDFCGPLVAVVASLKVQVPVTDNAASSRVNVVFSYEV